MTADPETIAGKLTEAQRAAVLSAVGVGDEAWGVSSTRLALVRKGLCRDGVRNGWSHSQLTPLGLSVRRILENSSHE